jgi:hypothetical protein
MGSEIVVFHSRPYHEYLSFPEEATDLSIQQFVSELTLETFTVAAFPQVPWFDEEGSYSLNGHPQVGPEKLLAEALPVYRYLCHHWTVPVTVQRLRVNPPQLMNTRGASRNSATRAGRFKAC